MSSNSGDSGGGLGLLYFCYTCSGTGSITPSPISDDLLCPTCHGGFVLVYHRSPDPNPNNNLPIPISRGGIRRRRCFIWWPSGQRVHQQSSSPPPPPRIGDRSPIPSEFLHGSLRYMIASGARAQVEVFLQRLHGGYRYSTCPASRSAVIGLPTIQITEESHVGDAVQCAICMNAFEVGVEAKLMPCKHLHHAKCILTWLEQHNTCPLCRYELPIEERRTRGSEAPVANPNVTGVTAVVSSGGRPSGGGVPGSVSGSNGGSSWENPHRPRSMEGRLRSLLRWPFRACGSPAETSNNNNDSQSNAGGGGN